MLIVVNKYSLHMSFCFAWRSFNETKGMLNINFAGSTKEPYEFVFCLY